MKKKKTFARELLENTVNGDKIVKRELDIHVNATCRDEDSIHYAIEIDFEGIFCEESPKQSTVVKDLLELQMAKCNNLKKAI